MSTITMPTMTTTLPRVEVLQVAGPARLEHVPALDGVRAIAAGSVVMAHVGIALWGMSYCGMVAMDTFFCLSGFLITRILLDAKARGGTLRQFYARRAARILPPLILVCAVVGFYTDWREVIVPLTFTTDVFMPWRRNLIQDSLGPTWSLGIEEKFYLLWPLAVMWMDRDRLRAVVRWLVVAPLVLLLFFPVWNEAVGGVETTYFSMPFRIPALAAGAWFAIDELSLRARPHICLWAAAILASVSVAFGAGRLTPYVRELFETIPMGIAIVLAALGLHWSKSTFAGFLTARPLTALGKISYGIYLYHSPIRAYARPFGPDRMAAITVIATVAVAAISYLAIERPLLRMSSRWIKDSRMNSRRNAGSVNVLESGPTEKLV